MLLCSWTPSEGALLEIDEGKRAMLFDPALIDRAVTITTNNKLTSVDITATSFEQACDQLSASLHLNAGYGFSSVSKIQGSLSAAYNRADQTSSSASMAQHSRMAIFATALLKFDGLVDQGAARKYLRPEILQAIDSLTTEQQVFRFYHEAGLYFPYSVSFGAVVNLRSIFTSVWSSTATSALAEMSMNYSDLCAKVNGAGAVEMQTANSGGATNLNVRICNYGGHIRHVIDGDTNEWLKSAAENPAPIRAEFHPIFLLAPPAKRDLFERVWRNYETEVTISRGPGPITRWMNIAVMIRGWNDQYLVNRGQYSAFCSTNRGAKEQWVIYPAPNRSVIIMSLFNAQTVTISSEGQAVVVSHNELLWEQFDLEQHETKKNVVFFVSRHTGKTLQCAPDCKGRTISTERSSREEMIIEPVIPDKTSIPISPRACT
jgi:hypothetical protein